MRAFLQKIVPVSLAEASAFSTAKNVELLGHYPILYINLGKPIARPI